MSDTILPLVLIAALIGALVWCIRMLILMTRKIRNSFREAMGKNPAEVDKAYDILNSCYKNGLVPSWAVQEALKTLKKFYTEEAALEGINTILRQNGVKYVDLPVEYKLLPPATQEQMAEMCYNKFKKFDMNYFTTNGQPNKRDTKTLDYLFRMWYFADGNVNTIDEATKAAGEVFIQYCRESAQNAAEKG